MVNYLLVVHGCVFAALKLPCCVCSDKNLFIKFTVGFNPIGNNKINLETKKRRSYSSLLSSQQHVSVLSNLGFALKYRLVNRAVCFSSLYSILTVNGVALNSSLVQFK